jgi:hypothetical protein
MPEEKVVSKEPKVIPIGNWGEKQKKFNRLLNKVSKKQAQKGGK